MERERGELISDEDGIQPCPRNMQDGALKCLKIWVKFYIVSWAYSCLITSNKSNFYMLFTFIHMVTHKHLTLADICVRNDAVSLSCHSIFGSQSLAKQFSYYIFGNRVSRVWLYMPVRDVRFGLQHLQDVKIHPCLISFGIIPHLTVD